MMKSVTELTSVEFAELLREAARAHAEYERELGTPDEDWPAWYADFILARLRERESAP